MAKYKVSYKILRQQGEDMKAVAKMVDGYAESIGKIRGKLGSDNMLAEIRNNLQKLSTQLGESRAILNTAGELLVKNVESYGGVELRQVKKVDAMKSQNRDFYKRPVVVASAGGAAGGAAAAATVNVAAPSAPNTSAASSAPVATTEQTAPTNTESSHAELPHVSVNKDGLNKFGPEMPTKAQPISAASVEKQQVTPANGNATVKAGTKIPNMNTAGKAAIGAAGAGIVGAGGVAGGRAIKKRRDLQKSDGETDTDIFDEDDSLGADPLDEDLEKARWRLAELGGDDE